MILLLGGNRVVEHAQNGTIGDGAQGPFPVVIVRQAANGPKLHRTEQSTQGDVDIEIAAGTQADLFAKSRQERRSGDFQSVDAGQEVGRGEVARLVGKDGECRIRGAEELHYGAHLRSSGAVAHESRDRSGPLCCPNWEREPNDECPSCELAQLQLCPTPWGNAGSYSTA